MNALVFPLNHHPDSLYKKRKSFQKYDFYSNSIFWNIYFEQWFGIKLDDPKFNLEDDYIPFLKDWKRLFFQLKINDIKEQIDPNIIEKLYYTGPGRKWLDSEFKFLNRKRAKLYLKILMGTITKKELDNLGLRDFKRFFGSFQHLTIPDFKLSFKSSLNFKTSLLLVRHISDIANDKVLKNETCGFLADCVVFSILRVPRPKEVARPSLYAYIKNFGNRCLKNGIFREILCVSNKETIKKCIDLLMLNNKNKKEIEENIKLYGPIEMK